MKKRSLVVSIAMLLVSAIVLSTSTYAWFSAGAKVSVDQITTKVSNSDGSIVIRAADLSSLTDAQYTALGYTADDLDWGTTLDDGVITALMGSTQSFAQNFFAPDSDTLIPISVKPGTAVTGAGNAGVYNNDTSNGGTALSMVSGTTSTALWDDDSDNTTPDKAVTVVTTDDAANSLTGKYLQYQFQIKANAACDVDLKATFATYYNFVLGAVRVDSKTYVYSKEGETISYYPLAKTLATGIKDINDDSIITAADHIATTNDVTTSLIPANAATTKHSDSTNAIELSFTANEIKTITVLIWAEGQEETCKGGIDEQSASFSFTAEKVTRT